MAQTGFEPVTEGLWVPSSTTELLSRVFQTLITITLLTGFRNPFFQKLLNFFSPDRLLEVLWSLKALSVQAFCLSFPPFLRLVNFCYGYEKKSPSSQEIHIVLLDSLKRSPKNKRRQASNQAKKLTLKGIFTSKGQQFLVYDRNLGGDYESASFQTKWFRQLTKRSKPALAG